MTEVRVCTLRTDLYPSREESIVLHEPDCSRVYRAGKARPPSTRVILVERGVEWRPVDEIDIDTCSLIIVVLVGERALSSLFLCHLVLDWGEFCLQDFFRGAEKYKLCRHKHGKTVIKRAMEQRAVTGEVGLALRDTAKNIL